MLEIFGEKKLKETNKLLNYRPYYCGLEQSKDIIRCLFPIALKMTLKKHHSVMKKNDIMLFSETWMDLESKY